MKGVSSLFQDSKKISVCIVGAGFSGLCMAIKLKKAGINFRYSLSKKLQLSVDK
jgi:cation diffusion facilitator CzcD-associated flavoprotein CzcO